MAAAPVVVVVRSSGSSGSSSPSGSGPVPSPPLCPSFAEVCSFLERFGAVLDLPEMTFPQMERYLRDTTAVPKPLVELHVKLLRKLGRSVTTDRWEKYLAKVCQELNSTWAWELEQKGYQEMSMECKSCILKYLCECQFDDNLKFKMAINEEEPEKMRMQPIGRDKQGLMYWLQLDQEQNIRLYTEEQDDLDGSTWKCIVRTRNDLAEALELLKAQVEPKQNPDQDQDQDQDQNQNQDQDQNQAGSRTASPTEKDAGDEAIGSTKSQPSKITEEVDPVKEEEPLTQVAVAVAVAVKLEETQPTKQENTEAEVKEEKTDHKSSPVFDNRVSTITTIIKSESRDADAPKNAVSVVMAPGATVAKQEMNKEEEAERAVVRSNQQAKIPLKKRELKIAESYHSNHLNNSNSSSIIVCNPSVIQTKESHGKEGKLPSSLAPPGGPPASQPQLVVTASRLELSNGRASLTLPHKEGQNGVIGVIGQVGVIGHVGVIRSPSERHRPSGAEQQEQNGPSLDHRGSRAVEEEKEVSRQSVLVRKGPVEGETAAAAAAALPPPAAMEAQPARKLQLSPLKSDPLPEAVEEKVDSVSLSSLSQPTEDPKRQTAEDLDKNTTEGETKTGHSSRQEKDENLEERRREVSGRPLAEEGNKDDHEKNESNLGKEAESGSTAPPLKVDQQDKKDHQGDGVNGGLAAQVRVKDIGLGSVEKQGPREEASSELQKEGIRLKIKIPPHRRNKLRGKGGKEEEKEKEQEVQEEGRTLRRSARICRSALPTCRPSSKATESQKKKPQKKQALSTKTREEEEEEGEEEEDEEEQSSTIKKDIKTEPVGQIRKQRGKRRHRRARWSNIRAKKRKLNEGEEVEDRGRKRGEGESEGGSDSEESCKSEEIPSEDACSHCGLPNHPELILLCDSCDNGYHTACLRPPLMLIPDGEWFCPPCQHKLLCEKLEEQLLNLDSALKKKERAERRRERLVYVGISVENIIPEGDEGEEEKSTKKKDPKKSKNLGRRSTRTRKNISYRFDDFDDAIDEAIEEDIRDLCGGAGQGRDITAILSEDGKESQRPIRSQAISARNRKKRRLNDLESDSTAAESEDEFMLSNSSEDEDFAASGADDDEEDDDDAGSDVGSVESGTRPRRAAKGAPKIRPSRTQRRGRKRLRRRRRRSSEEEEEETDEEMGSDQFSDMTDSDAEKKRRGLRRGQRQQVNYRETSESSDNSRASAKKVKVRPRGRPRKEHLSSDYSDVTPSSRDSEEEEDYEDQEDDDQRRRVNKRRRKEEDLRSNRTREKRRRYERDEEEEDDDRERGRRLKRKLLEKEKTDKDKRRRLKRTEREEEDLEKMGRGKRREILSQQRRKRLAQMLKKRRPSTDDEDEDEEDSEESESSSEEDRPIRKRLNRIDSDDDDDDDNNDDDEEEEDDEEEGRQKVTMKKCSAVERRADSDTQEKGRGRSLSPSNGHRTSRGPAKPGAGSPSVPRDSEGSGRHNGPLHPEEEEEKGEEKGEEKEEEKEEKEEEEDEEEGQTDSLNSVQNSPQS